MRTHRVNSCVLIFQSVPVSTIGLARALKGPVCFVKSLSSSSMKSSRSSEPFGIIELSKCSVDGGGIIGSRFEASGAETLDCAECEDGTSMGSAVKEEADTVPVSSFRRWTE